MFFSKFMDVTQAQNINSIKISSAAPLPQFLFALRVAKELL